MSEAPIKSIPARFGAFNDRRVSEELEGFVPVINESPQGRDRRCGTARAAPSGMGSSRRFAPRRGF